MIEENSCEFINWVKIRIGEPLTALEIDKCNYACIQKKSTSDPSLAISATMILD